MQRCLPGAVNPTQELILTREAHDPDVRTAGRSRPFKPKPRQHDRCGGTRTRPGRCQRIAPLQTQLIVLQTLTKPTTKEDVAEVGLAQQVTTGWITEGEIQARTTTRQSRAVINQLQFMIVDPTAGEQKHRGLIVFEQKTGRC